MSDHVEQVVSFLPWEEQMPDFVARPKNRFVPFEDSEIEQSIPHRYAKMVKKYGERLAIKDRERELTYSGLNELANRLAWAEA